MAGRKPRLLHNHDFPRSSVLLVPPWISLSSHVLVTLWFLHTNFLAALSPRYCYYYQPLVILAGTAAAMTLYDRVVSLAHRAGNSTVARACCACHRARGDDFALSAKQRIGDEGVHPFQQRRSADTDDSHEYIQIRLPRRGGVCKESLPAGRPDCARHCTRVRVPTRENPAIMCWILFSASKAGYNQLLAEPRFVDKFGGVPVVRNLTELREVVSSARRTWVVFAPYADFEQLSDPSVIDYLNQTSKVEFETYRAKVMLVERADQPKGVAKTP